MPRDLLWAEGHDRSRSLGVLAVSWMEFFVRHGRGDAQGAEVELTDEYAKFVVDCYVVDVVGRPMYDSAFLSRPKGCDKSGQGARFALFEALGPCRFDGWAEGGEVYEDPWGLGFRYEYEPGEPMGRHITDPFVRCLATEEGQSGNVYATIHYNLTDSECPLSAIPGMDAGVTRVFLPGGGEIRPSTASSASKDGGLETFVVFDETHLYNLPELRAMYRTVVRNLRKRKKTAGGTWFLETTTMFAPGEDSVAELTYKLADQIKAKKKDGGARNLRQRLLLDHRWGECEDLSSEDMLREAILEAFGECIEWNDIDGIVDEFYDTRNEPSDSRRYFLNAPTSTADAWLAHHEWAARLDLTKVVADQDMITIGFDGSRGRQRGVADATALIGCRVSDGHMFELGVWEQPTGAAGAGWEVPTTAVEAAVRSAFERYNVVGFYADPAGWSEHVSTSTATYRARLKANASQPQPISWKTNRITLVSESLQALHDAILNGGMTHSGEDAMTRHFLNARRRPVRSGVIVSKTTPESPNKIDAAYAGMLAFKARLDAIAAGAEDAATQSWVPRRIR